MTEIIVPEIAPLTEAVDTLLERLREYDEAAVRIRATLKGLRAQLGAKARAVAKPRAARAAGTRSHRRRGAPDATAPVSQAQTLNGETAAAGDGGIQ